MVLSRFRQQERNMIDNKLDVSEAPHVLRDVLDEIETLRLKRQEEIRSRPHPRLKRFTQQELTDEACPTYKNLLVGRSRRVPSRQTIIQIAQYLECSAQERNDLLLAARYLPESLELEGLQLKQALEQAQHLMKTLPYPAALVTHTLEIQAINEAFQHVFECPPLAAIPQRHLFYFLFHPDSPLRKRSTFNDQAINAWQAQTLRGVQLFKQSNVLYQFEHWYQELIERFYAVSDFRVYWEQEAGMLEQKEAPAKMFLSRRARTGELLPIQLKTVHISVCSYRYPCIAASLPLDEAAHEVFASLS
jgi:hypothetical protein